jgi:hypothetical protein
MISVTGRSRPVVGPIRHHATSDPTGIASLQRPSPSCGKRRRHGLELGWRIVPATHPSHCPQSLMAGVEWFAGWRTSKGTGQGKRSVPHPPARTAPGELAGASLPSSVAGHLGGHWPPGNGAVPDQYWTRLSGS